MAPKRNWSHPMMSNQLAALPSELGRHRILPTKQALEFVGSSPANWRRLRALKLAPAPVMIGLRRQGWRVGDLIDYLESRSQKAPVDEPHRDPRHVLTSEPRAA
jgi:predicted DNA-binding transcriptional regulator AlpA